MTEPPKTILVRDITLGCLFIVLSGFLYYFSWGMMNYIPVLDFLIAMVFLWVGRLLLNIGYLIIRGLSVDVS
jgi:hypothetical protein